MNDIQEVKNRIVKLQRWFDNQKQKIQKDHCSQENPQYLRNELIKFCDEVIWKEHSLHINTKRIDKYLTEKVWKK